MGVWKVMQQLSPPIGKCSLWCTVEVFNRGKILPCGALHRAVQREPQHSQATSRGHAPACIPADGGTKRQKYAYKVEDMGDVVVREESC